MQQTERLEELEKELHNSGLFQPATPNTLEKLRARDSITHEISNGSGGESNNKADQVPLSPRFRYSSNSSEIDRISGDFNYVTARNNTNMNQRDSLGLSTANMRGSEIFPPSSFDSFARLSDYNFSSVPTQAKTSYKICTGGPGPSELPELTESRQSFDPELEEGGPTNYAADFGRGIIVTGTNTSSSDDAPMSEMPKYDAGSNTPRMVKIPVVKQQNCYDSDSQCINTQVLGYAPRSSSTNTNSNIGVSTKEQSIISESNIANQSPADHMSPLAEAIISPGIEAGHLKAPSPPANESLNSSSAGLNSVNNETVVTSTMSSGNPALAPLEDSTGSSNLCAAGLTSENLVSEQSQSYSNTSGTSGQRIINANPRPQQLNKFAFRPRADSHAGATSLTTTSARGTPTLMSRVNLSSNPALNFQTSQSKQNQGIPKAPTPINQTPTTQIPNLMGGPPQNLLSLNPPSSSNNINNKSTTSAMMSSVSQSTTSHSSSSTNINQTLPLVSVNVPLQHTPQMSSGARAASAGAVLGSAKSAVEPLLMQTRKGLLSKEKDDRMFAGTNIRGSTLNCRTSFHNILLIFLLNDA